MKCISAGVFKLLSVMLVVLVVAAAIGCGKKGAEEATPTPAPTAAPTATATIPAEPTGETGTLSGLQGDVQVLRGGANAWIAASNGMKVGTGYGLKTGSDGYVLITFFDGSVMEVEAGTEISIEELSKASGGSTTIRINQVLGNTINRVENLVDSSSTYEVETPAGSAVVRGTVYGVNVNQYNGLVHTCINNIDQGDTQDHYVGLSGGGKTVEVPEDKSACCWEGGQPGQPFYTDPGDDPFNQDGGGNSCPSECWGEGCLCQCCCQGEWICYGYNECWCSPNIEVP